MGRTRNDLAMFANLYLFRGGRNHRNPYSEVAQSSHHRNYSIYIHNPLYTFTVLVNVSRVINYVIDYTIPPNTDTNLPPPPRTLQKPPMTISNKNDITRTLQKPPIDNGKQKTTSQEPSRSPQFLTACRRNCHRNYRLAQRLATAAAWHAATAVASLLVIIAPHRNCGRTANALQGFWEASNRIFSVIPMSLYFL